MNILFFTKPKASTLECLKFLYEQGEELLGVVIYDSQRFKGGDFWNFCMDKKIKIYDGDEIYSDSNRFKDKLDVIFVNTYPKLIRNGLIEMAGKGAVNFHAAPLPEYRGVFGYNFAIYNGERRYGVTVHQLSGQFDRGDIIEVDRFDIDPDNITVRELVDLSDRHLIALFKKTFLRIKNDEEIDFLKQGEGRYYSRKDFEELKQIRDTDSADVIKRKIRAFWYPPYEGAYMVLQGEKFGLVTEDIMRSYSESAGNHG